MSVDCFYESETCGLLPMNVSIAAFVEPECPADAIRPETEPDMEKWVEFNRKYPKLWPVNHKPRKTPCPRHEERER